MTCIKLVIPEIPPSNNKYMGRGSRLLNEIKAIDQMVTPQEILNGFR